MELGGKDIRMKMVGVMRERKRKCEVKGEEGDEGKVKKEMKEVKKESNKQET